MMIKNASITMSFVEKKTISDDTTASALGSSSVQDGLCVAAALSTRSASKRKRDYADDTSTIVLLMTYIHEYLCAQMEPRTGPEILQYLEQNSYLREPSASMYHSIIDVLRSQAIVRFIPDPQLSEQKWDSGTYSYIGRLGGIQDKSGLLAHLQAKATIEPLQYKELRVSWPQCDTALAELERSHEIIIIRDKTRPRHIFSDDAALYHEVGPEFLRMWQSVNVPDGKDLNHRLVEAGQKPASTDPSQVNQPTSGSKKRRNIRKHAQKRPSITTNIHMQHLLKDFSVDRRQS
jgi:transcription initiation factor TFIIE subunit beta